MPRGDHRLQRRHGAFAAAARDGHVLPGVSLLRQILLEDVERGCFAARRPPVQHLNFLDVGRLGRARESDRRNGHRARHQRGAKLHCLPFQLVTLPPDAVRRRLKRPRLAAPDLVGSTPPARQPPARARTIVSVERFFLSVVLDGAKPKLVQSNHVSRSRGKRASASANVASSMTTGRWALMNSLLSSGEVRGALVAERGDALGEVLGRGRQSARQPFDWRVTVLALGGVDHRLDDLHRYRAALGDVGGDRMGPRERFALPASLRRLCPSSAPPPR